jgi:hypothetical protein
MILSFIRNRRGGVATVVALMAPALMGFGALAVDLGSWHATKRSMQTAADTAAIAASWVMVDGGSSTDAIAAGKASAAANGFSEADGNVVNVVIDGSNDRATATITRDADLFLAGMFFEDDPQIVASAVAGPQNSAPVCLLGLQGFDTGITENGGSASTDIWGTNCAIQANSSDSEALRTNGTNALIEGLSVCANYAEPPTGNDIPNSVPAAHSCSPILDPFPTQLAPEWNGTAASCPTSMAPTPTETSSQVTLHGGCYINDDKNIPKNLIFETGGTFFLHNSSLKLTGGNNNATGVNITIFLYGNSTIDLSGSKTLNLKAKPTTSTSYPNILIAADASNTTDMRGGSSADSSFGGSSDSELRGIIYLPKQDLRVHGTASLVATDSSIVANTITVVGNGQLTITAPANGSPTRTAVMLLN